MSDLQQFYRWWKRLRRDGETVPRIKDFDPADLDGAGWVYVMHDEGGGAIRMVHFGAALAKFVAVDMHGKDYAAIMPASEAQVLREYMMHACMTPCGAFMDQRVKRLDGGEVRYLHLDLPMADDDGKVCLLAGCVSPLKETVPEIPERRERLLTYLLNFRDFDLESGPSLEAWQKEIEETVDKDNLNRQYGSA